MNESDARFAERMLTACATLRPQGRELLDTVARAQTTATASPLSPKGVAIKTHARAGPRTVAVLARAVPPENGLLLGRRRSRYRQIMCLVVYVASSSNLPLVHWRQDAPAFNVTELTEYERPVVRQFSLPHVRQAGSHTSCGCGFNEGRGDRADGDEDHESLADSLESSSRLAQYVAEHRVEQIYTCWSGDEDEPAEHQRTVRPADLAAPEFCMRERELLLVELDPA